MKLLIVMDQLPPHLTATSEIVYQLGEQLFSEYGVEVAFIGNCQGDVNSQFQMWGSTDVWKYSQKIPANLPKWRKLFLIAVNPTLWRVRKDLSSHPRYPLCKIYQRLLAKAIREKPDFDCILCATNPWDTLYAAVKTQKRIPIVAYKADPWGTNTYCIGNRKFWEDEQWADEHCEAIFVPAPVYQDYVAGINTAPLNKVYKVEFPNMKKPQWRPDLAPQFERDKIHCAYVGQLYDDIRSPEFMFELFRCFEQESIVLHIVGNTEHQAKKYMNKLPSNVILHGKVSPEEASMYMQTADILVNLGNTVTNQLPSKLISYMACGKPILNICKIYNCISLPYIQKYPLALNLLEPDGLNDNLAEKVALFLKNNYEKKVCFEDVSKIFPECTPEYVGDIIYKALLKITSKGNADNGTDLLRREI